MSGSSLVTGLASQPGFYGKLLSHGDFVGRGLSRRFVDIWDRWLQSSLATSEQALGMEWLECYLHAPIWRFALGSGICGDDAWIGVLMPSVDKVGRHFPLTIAVAIPSKAALNETLARADRWYNRIETLALSTLNDDFQLPEFESELQLTPLPIWSGRSNFRPFAGRGTRPPQCAVWLLQPDSERVNAALFASTYPIWSNFRLDGQSLWASAGSEDMYPALVTSQSLPPATRFPAFVCGKWDEHGWRTNR